MFRLACLLLAFVAASSGASIADSKIVGGTNAPLGWLPWIVSLRHNNNHFCGGTILNQRWILTAGHCLIEPLRTLTIVSNTVLLNSGGDHYRANRFVFHPNYNAVTLDHDIGLIQTASNIIYRNTVAPIALPTSHFAGENVWAEIAGWGRTSYPGSLPNHLQYIWTIIIPQSECRRVWGVTDDVVCTFIQPGQGTCHGDSGSPLTSGGVLVGVASFAQPCAIGWPDGFARVFPYVSWIRGHIG